MRLEWKARTTWQQRAAGTRWSAPGEQRSANLSRYLAWRCAWPCRAIASRWTAGLPLTSFRYSGRGRYARGCNRLAAVFSLLFPLPAHLARAPTAPSVRSECLSASTEFACGGAIAVHFEMTLDAASFSLWFARARDDVSTPPHPRSLRCACFCFCQGPVGHP